MFGIKTESVGGAVAGVFQQNIEELISSIFSSMSEAGEFAEMEIEVVERIGLQDQGSKVARSICRQQVANQIKKFLRLKIDGIEVEKVRWRLRRKHPDTLGRALPERHEVVPFTYEVNRAHRLGSLARLQRTMIVKKSYV